MLFPPARTYLEYEKVHIALSAFFFHDMQMLATLQRNPIYVLFFGELRGLSPNFHIHVHVINLYIPRIGPHISCSRIGRSIVEI
jgi:hypothetical protein